MNTYGYQHIGQQSTEDLASGVHFNDAGYSEEGYLLARDFGHLLFPDRYKRQAIKRPLQRMNTSRIVQTPF